MTTGHYNSGLIEPPLRLPLFGEAIVLLVIGVQSVVFTLPDGGGIIAIVTLSVLFILAYIRRLNYALHVPLLTLLMLLLLTYFPFLQGWPFSLLLPLTVYAIMVRMTPVLRHSVGWIHKGRMNSGVISLSIITVIVSAFALLGWIILLVPDIQHHMALVPDIPVWTYPLIGIFFAVLNAVMEESVFRGVVMESLDSALGAGYWAVIIQAIPFAALHVLSGFPSGVPGFIMTFIYGIMLGSIRRLSKGMLAPIATHMATDLTIFSIVAYFIVQSD